jgi:hypothetical protein
MGKPLLLAACPTCVKQIKKYLPEIAITTVYQELAERGEEIFRMSSSYIDSECAVFDPCSAGSSPNIKNAVRSLALSAGIKLSELPIQSDVARCCGYGGQPGIANPDYAAFVAKKRASESELPYITYCINCSEAFAGEGKRTAHILEILFPKAESRESICYATPGLSQRRENRMLLKKMMMGEPELSAGEIIIMENDKYGFELVIDGRLREKLDAGKMLEEEAYAAVDFALSTKRFVIDGETGHKSAYRKLGNMTYWVTFDDSAYPEIQLLNAYSHRMSIEMEQVWNGVKTIDYEG